MAMSTSWDKVSDYILERLAGGVIPWRKPWRLAGGLRASDSPWRNGFTGYRYSGVNTLILAASGFDSPTFGTFNQIKKAGGSVVKGETSTPIVFWKLSRFTEDDDDGTPVAKFVPMLRLYRVFNLASQTTGLPARFWDVAIDGPKEPEPEPKPEPERIEKAERIVSEYFERPDTASLVHRCSNSAFYAPGPDRIIMPNRTQFPTPAGLYSTLFHEGIHSTGHRSRLDRKDLGHPFGSKPYAREELTAEIGAAFLMAESGMTFDDMDSVKIAGYIANWQSALKTDPKCFVLAATRARKAARIMIGLPADEKRADDSPADKPEPVTAGAK